MSQNGGVIFDHVPGLVCVNIILEIWDRFLHNGLTELQMFSMIRGMTFFGSNVFVISTMVFILIRRQFSEGAL